MVRVADFAFEAPISDLNRDTTRLRKVLRVEAEDRNIACVQFGYYRARVRIVVVSNNQDGGRHCSTLRLSTRVGAGAAAPAPLRQHASHDGQASDKLELVVVDDEVELYVDHQNTGDALTLGTAGGLAV